LNPKLISPFRGLPAVALASLCAFSSADPQLTVLAAEFLPAKQQFRQELAEHFKVPGANLQLLDITADGTTRCFAGG
jgi:hypothetical protein